ncbi:MAG: hypothetical protein ACPK7O_01505 [Methanobacterium sp.]
MEIIVKKENEDLKPSEIQNLLNNGLKGKFVLQSVTQDTKKGEYVFKYQKR